MSTKPRPDSSNILGVSMNLDLKEKIKRLAEAEDRTMSQWCALALRRIVEDIEARQQPVALGKVAETMGNESSLSIHAPTVKVRYPSGKQSRRKQETG
jgi:predicted transcriptional regulator